MMRESRPDVDLVKSGEYLLLVVRDDRFYEECFPPADRNKGIYELSSHVGPAIKPKARGASLPDPRIDPFHYLIAFYARKYRRFTFCDVGAHYGVTAMDAVSVALAYGGKPRSFAFDCGVASDLTWRNFRNNKFDIRFERLAIGPVDGHAVMFLEATMSVNNRLINAGEGGSVPVECVRLDTYLESQRALGPACVKIDTQGAEPGVIAGMRKLMTAGPVSIKLEFTPWAMRQSRQDPVAFAESLQRTHRLFSIGHRKEFLREVSSPKDLVMQVDEVAPHWCDLLALPTSIPSFAAHVERLRAACFA